LFLDIGKHIMLGDATMKAIKFIVTILFVVSVCSGAQSIVLTNGTQATGSYPTRAALTSLSTFRFEFRLHNFTPAVDQNGWIVTFGPIWSTGIGVRFLPQPNGHIVINVADFPGDNISIDLGNRTDMLVRFQRSASGLTLEAWNPDGTNYAHAEAPLGNYSLALSGTTVTFGASTCSTDLAYMRVYSTVLTENSPPPSRTDGDLGDWEFEGNLNDISSYRAKLSGAVSYAPTPTIPVNVSFGQFGSQRVWSANLGSLALNASGTYSSVDNPAYVYTWSQVSGPSTGTFSNPNQISTTFSAPVPGDYLINLAVSDGVTTGQLSVDFGAVITDANGIVQTGNPSMDIALGPLTIWGTSPWPWYDLTEMADADSLYSLVTTPPTYGINPLSGTITVTNAGNGAGQIVTGTGTNFLADIIDCNSSSSSGTTYTCTAPSLSSLSDFPARDRFWIPDVDSTSSPTLNINGYGALPVTGGPFTAGQAYHLSINPGLTSYQAYLDSGPLIYVWLTSPSPALVLENVQPWCKPLPCKAISATQLTLLNYNGWIGPSQSGLSYSHPDTQEQFVYWNYASQPSNNLDYYDVVHALYKLAYRTGLTKYLTEARTFADLWYLYSVGQGYWTNPPRAMGLLGIIDRAIDGQPAYWTALDNWFPLEGEYPVFTYMIPQTVAFPFDTRETGYAVRYAVRAAALFANSDGTPNPAKRTAYCAMLHNVVVNVLAGAQDSLGQWESDGYSANISAPYAKLNGKFGSSPWRDAMSGIALEEAYPILSNQCNDPSSAATALTTAVNFAILLHDQGEGTGYGQFGNINYASAQYTNVHGYSIAVAGQWILPNTTGALNVTSGGTTVTGTGTNFTAIYSAIYKGQTPAVAVDASFIAVPAQRDNGASCDLVLPVASVQSDTQLTLATAWPCASASNVTGAGYGWMAAPAAPNNCASYGSSALTCEGVPDPSLAHEMHMVWSWLYWQTGDNKYRTWAQQSMGTDYGGPGGGPGTPTVPVGPYATGNPGNFAWDLPACVSAPSPCGGYGPVIGLGKNYAFSAGAGNANNALAYLSMTPLTSSRGANPSPPIRRIIGPAVVKGNTQ
jgi:hypothetical protein